MKRILITGKNSYIGSSFEQFLTQWPDEYRVDTIDMVGDNWKRFDFSQYDAIYHVAGIVHRKETGENAKEYYLINRDLAVKVAKKAKKEGVRQFIFLSTGTIYGIETGIIDSSTPIKPKTNYGKSKAQAEQAILKMGSSDFKVVILRPLMVYGKNCKGNFQSIIQLVKKSPVFPRVHNRRSLIYIDNLSSFVKMSIDQDLSGVFFPKNQEDVDIYDIVTGVANVLGKKIYMSWTLGICMYIVRKWFSLTRKAFTDKIYCETDQFHYCYCVCSTKQSIEMSV